MAVRLRWLFRCLAGRRCADVRVVEPDTVTHYGGIVILEYTCGGCGTVYHYDTETKQRTKA